MAGRRGARSGRGWDAIPPRTGADASDGDSSGDPVRRESRRGAYGRRRRSEADDEGLWQTFGSSSESPEEAADLSGSLAGAAFDVPAREAGVVFDVSPRGAGVVFDLPVRGAGDTFDTSVRGLGGAAGRRAEGAAGPGDGIAGGRADGVAGGRADGVAGRRAESSAGGRGDGAAGRRSGVAGRRAEGAADAPARKASPQQSESERAREICLHQLAARPRTRAELAKAMARKEISEEVIAEVLDRYDEVGIIDDAAFARAWVSSRHHGRGLARRALANELRQRGVDAEVASEALGAVDDESEAAIARALVDRKLRTATGTPEAVFRRLVAMLARKGYPAGIAIRAVKDALAARDEEAAEFAAAVDADALADQADEALS
ncbi:hypothetical protein Areg01_16890 [Actinoplanes regularis]|nr:hypothetical protein Areg01_16890 [Actinoplanes regularis]